MESIIALDESLIAVMDASNDAMALVDTESGQCVAINDTHFRLFGFPLNTISQLGLDALYQYAQDRLPKKILQNLLQLKQTESLLCPAVTYHGDTIDVEVSCTTLPLLDKTYLLLISKLINDNTADTQGTGSPLINESFHDSEAKWQSITESSADHIMLLDTNATILYINHTVPNLTHEQVIGRCAYDFLNPKDVDRTKQCYEGVARTAQPATLDLEYATDDGIIYLENRVAPVLRYGRVVALTVASRNVTRRRHTLAALEKSQEHLKFALAAGATGTWDWDLTTNEITWSDNVESLFGLQPGSFAGSYSAYRQLIHPEDVEKVETAINQTLENHRPFYVEHRCIFPDGSIHWLNGQGKIYRDETGNPLRMIGTVTDVTQRREAEERLRHKEFLLSKSQEIAHIGSYSWDIASNKFQWSDEMYRIFGLSRDDFDGSAQSVIEKAIHPDDREKLYLAQQKVIAEKKPQLVEYRILAPDGSIRYVDTNSYLNFNEKGEVVSVIGTVQDITDQVIAQQELEQHRKHLEELVAERTKEIREQALILEQIHDSVVSTDLNGTITSWNRGAERMLGVNANDAIGRHISFIYPESEHQFLTDEIIRPLKEKGENEVEVRLQRKSGEFFDALLSLSMRYDEQGNTIGMIGYSIDITARKQAEQEALQHKLALEHANKELEAFSYSVSHDLRSPLRAIDGFSAVLLEDYNELLDEDGKENLNRIRSNAQHMADLIDDLLQLSRVSRKAIHKEHINLAPIANDFIEKYKHENPGQKIQLNMDDQLIADADTGLISVVLDNLLSNACKYSSKRPQTEIVFSKQQKDGATVFCIKDNGAGFDMRYAHKLFGAFQRLHRPEEFPGNGIGLATVSRIIRRHGGKIWAEGNLNKGAQFYFTLPGS